MFEPLLTPKQASERLLVSEKAVLDWLRFGTLKGVKAGRQWRIRERDLEAFLVEPEPVRADAEASAWEPPATRSTSPIPPRRSRRSSAMRMTTTWRRAGATIPLGGHQRIVAPLGTPGDTREVGDDRHLRRALGPTGALGD
jgi:excisionase family DNA binding protein